MTERRKTVSTTMLDEDVRTLSARLDRHLEIYAQNGKELAALKVAVENHKQSIEDKIDDLFQFFKDHDADERELHAKFVTDDRFAPIQRVVYGGVTLILTAVLMAIIGVVITR